MATCATSVVTQIHKRLCYEDIIPIYVLGSWDGVTWAGRCELGGAGAGMGVLSGVVV